MPVQASVDVSVRRAGCDQGSPAKELDGADVQVVFLSCAERAAYRPELFDQLFAIYTATVCRDLRFMGCCLSSFMNPCNREWSDIWYQNTFLAAGALISESFKLELEANTW